MRVRNYPASVLPGLADFPINRIAKLTPTAWGHSILTNHRVPKSAVARKFFIEFFR